MVGSGHSRICQGKGLRLLRSSLIIFVNLTETLFLFASQRARVFYLFGSGFFLFWFCFVLCFVFVGEGSEGWRGHH